MPKFAGERRFAQRLGSLLDNRAHAWFGVDYLHGVNDIYLLLWHDAIGVFIIEVKAIPLSMIESFGLTYCKIQDLESGPSPHVQAYRAEVSLRRHLQGKKLKLYNVPTAAFPEITRAEWNSAWSESAQLSGEWAQTVLFQDDLQSGSELLLDRLAYIYRNPPCGGGE